MGCVRKLKRAAIQPFDKWFLVERLIAFHYIIYFCRYHCRKFSHGFRF
jgi:hypothetical protein